MWRKQTLPVKSVFMTTTAKSKLETSSEELFLWSAWKRKLGSWQAVDISSWQTWVFAATCPASEVEVKGSIVMTIPVYPTPIYPTPLPPYIRPTQSLYSRLVVLTHRCPFVPENKTKKKKNRTSEEGSFPSPNWFMIVLDAWINNCCIIFVDFFSRAHALARSHTYSHNSERENMFFPLKHSQAFPYYQRSWVWFDKCQS